MKYKHIYLLITTLVLLCTGSCKEEEKPAPAARKLSYEECLNVLKDNPYDLDANRTRWIHFSRKGMFDSILVYSWPLANNREHTELAAYAGINIAQSHLFLENYDSVKIYIDRLTSRYKDEKLPLNWYVILNNILGAYSIKVNLDYPKAMEHFKTALEYADRMGDKRNACIFLCNIVNIYTIRNDSSGVSYAKRAYEISNILKDPYMQCFATTSYAIMLYLKEDYANSLKYAKEAQKILEEHQVNALKAQTYLIIANIYSGTHVTDSAKVFFRKAMDWMDTSDPSTYIKLCYSYGQCLMNDGEYKEAEKLMKKGLEISENFNNIEYRDMLHLNLSKIYEKTGRKKEAFEYYKMYQNGKDSTFNQANEQKFNQLLVQYEKAEHENTLEEKQQTLYIMIYIIISVSLISASIYILYTRKNRMYRKLVEQHQQYMAEKDLISDMAKEEKTDNESIRDKELFDKISSIVTGEKLYRDSEISLDRLAERLGTNRVYISQAINRYSKKTFYNYINSLRIDDATKVLSNPEDNTPLKQLCTDLGYNSISAFYRAFQKETGCPPSKYREQIREIAKEQK